MIYPNPAKDIETLQYPYAELFRDFSAALCRPNSALVTYGYGFGDDHINRVIADMLTIPSTHLVILSYDPAQGRIPNFIRIVGRDAQISLLVGKHFGDISNLVNLVAPQNDITFEEWLESYIGKDMARNGPLAVIDLSLVPSDLLHIIATVIARIVYEAVQRCKNLMREMNFQQFLSWKKRIPLLKGQ
jgi:hypothetical protein